MQSQGPSKQKEEAEGKVRVSDMKTQLTITDFEEEDICEPKLLDNFYNPGQARKGILL